VNNQSKRELVRGGLVFAGQDDKKRHNGPFNISDCMTIEGREEMIQLWLVSETGTAIDPDGNVSAIFPQFCV
jgi:hypothetical protein